MAASDDELIEGDLDDWLDIQVPFEQEDGGEEEIQAPPDEELADKLLYKTRRLKSELARHQAIADRRKAEIDAWIADRTAGTTAEIGRIAQSLDLFMWRWFRQTKGRKGKTLKLANGQLKLVARQARMVYSDPHAAAAWLKSHGREDLLIMEPKPAKKKIEEEGTKHKATQQTVAATNGEQYLAQTFRVAVEAANPETGEKAETTIPGVIWAEAAPEAADSFTFLTLEEVDAKAKAAAARRAAKEAGEDQPDDAE